MSTHFGLVGRIEPRINKLFGVILQVRKVDEKMNIRIYQVVRKFDNAIDGYAG